MPAVRITVADQTITAQLADNPTAQDLTDQLPLTLTFRDFNRVEKVAELPRPLTMDGVRRRRPRHQRHRLLRPLPQPRLLLRRRRLLEWHCPHWTVHRPGHRADRAATRRLRGHHRPQLITEIDHDHRRNLQLESPTDKEH